MPEHKPFALASTPAGNDPLDIKLTPKQAQTLQHLIDHFSVNTYELPKSVVDNPSEAEYALPELEKGMLLEEEKFWLVRACAFIASLLSSPHALVARMYASVSGDLPLLPIHMNTLFTGFYAHPNGMKQLQSKDWRIHSGGAESLGCINPLPQNAWNQRYAYQAKCPS
jgi:hypothetical protein